MGGGRDVVGGGCGSASGGLDMRMCEEVCSKCAGRCATRRARGIDGGSGVDIVYILID